MKKSIGSLVLVSALGLALAGWKSVRNNDGSSVCSDPNMRTTICLNMRYLRSHVMLLGEQRDLLQVNYRLLASIGLSIEQVVSRLMTSNAYDEHLQGIETIRETAADLARLAQQNEPEAFVAANSIRKHCTQCHQNPASSQHLNWQDLLRTNWETIVNRCNEVGRNPHLCKNMYGMVSSIAYFQAAANLGIANFDLGYRAAAELARVAGYIQQFRTHADSPVLSLVEYKAKEIMKLAESKDSKFVDLGYELTSTCFHCHK